MRNIYDIIAEQKLITDINIYQYEMNYINECFLADNEYIEEGIGESIKNIAHKVIEFIKKIINGIKEMARKLINWILGRKDTVKKMNDEIAEANAAAGGGSSDNNEKNEDLKKKKDDLEEIRDRIKKNREDLEKQLRKNEAEAERKKRAREKEEHKKENERRDNIKKSYKKLDDIHAVLKECKSKVNMVPFTKLDNKVNLAKKFFANMERVSKELVSKNIISDDILIREVIDKTFTGPGSFDSNNGSAMEIGKRINLELVESGEDSIETYISVHADKIYEYISKGDEAVKYIQGQEKTATNNLNKLLHYVEQISSGNQLAGNNADINKRINMIRAASAAISEFVSAICKSIVKSINVSTTIAAKAKNDYIAQIRQM